MGVVRSSEIPNHSIKRFPINHQKKKVKMPESNFFTEEASRQILLRIANVFNDPDLCDAVFVVGEGDKQEEIPAPSQFMAVSSPYFKDMFFPPRANDDKKRVIEGMQPNVFRKILDYLFKGKVPLSSIDDAWKVKVAGRTFQLKELEELTTKFLKYRLDSQNLLVYLKNSCKYECPDLREVIVNRFLKEAMAVLDDPHVLDLSEEELIELISKEPEVQAKKLMSVLIKWAKKRYLPETDEEPEKKKPKLEETEEKKTEEKTEKDDAEKKEDGEKKEDDKTEEEKKKVEEKPNLIPSLQPFIKYIHWDHSDAEFFLKEVRNSKIMTEEEENVAMGEMLRSFVDKKPTQSGKNQPSRITSRTQPTPASRRGTRERGPASGPELAVVGEKQSKNPGSGGVIVNKTDDDIVL